MKVSRSCALWSSVCCVSVLWVPAVWYTWNTEYISAIDRHGPDGRTHASRQKVAIILQRSPVEMADQYKRLEAIDNSWADWGKQNGPAIHDINVYASITNPQEKDMTNLASVAHITPVIVRDLNPLVRLTDALLTVSVRGRSTPTWVVLANDHTFFIIPNLSCFLASLDYDDVVYTGNSLAIKMSDGVLVFASGGGGAVLSAAAVKITLLAWTLADISRVSEALRVVNSSISTGSIVPMSKPGVSWVDYLSFCAPSVVVSEYKDSTQSFHTNSGVFQLSLSPSCLDGINLLRSLQLLVFIFEKRAAQYVITLYITKTVSLLLRRLDSEPRTVQFTNSNKRYEGNATSFLLDEEKIAKKCVDHSKWGLDNPGISIATCLQRIFDATMPDSAYPSISPDDVLPSGRLWRERFHVYGPVRTAVTNTDPWYEKMKDLIADHPSLNFTGKLPRKSQRVFGTISFHYVGHVESKLLHRLFRFMELKQERHIHTAELEKLLMAQNISNKVIEMRNTLAQDNGNVAQSNKHIHKDNAKAILKLWPKKELGGYGRKLNGLQEAEQLYEFLFKTIAVLRWGATDSGPCIAPDISA